MADMSMNSNLMFRSMFFMNDEATRHFLAPPLPPIQPCDIQSDYFQKKLMSQVSSSSTPGSSSVTTSSTNTGNISASTTNTNTTGTTTTGTNTTNPSNHQTTSSVGAGLPTPENKLTITLPKQRPHTCEECGKTFLMKHHLLTHMRVVHTGERPYICPECGKSFALKHCLSTHLLLHTADRPYKCNECNKSFTLKHHLVSHERVHTRDRPFECTECGQRFPQKRHLSTHIKFHSGERPFSCQVCGESFSREEHLVMHSRFHGGLSPYNCPDCGAGFLRKFELVNHERQHGRNPESCPNCGKEFLQKRTLLVHMRSCNGNGPISLATTQQSFSPPRFSDSGSPPRFSDNSPPRFNDGMTQRFPNNSNSPRYSENSNQFRFSDGQMRFSNDNTPSSSPMPPMQAQKDKVCKECGETFASVEGLALHLRLHFGDHSFLADICSLAASLKQTAVNVAASLKKTHICTDCGRGFTQRHGLFQHRQRYANGSCKEKPFACEKCGKSFAQKNHLMLHERQHMDLPPRNLKISQKGPQSNPDNVEQMDTLSEAGHQVDRTHQGERTSQSSEIVMQNHSDHQRIDLLNRHASKSSDNIPQSEKGNINMMMQANHPNHQRDLLNRHSSDSSTDRSSQMQQDLLNRHNSESSDSTSQSEKGNINMLMQSNHSDHQRELLNRHPSESSSDRSLQMQQSHSDSHLSHPVSLIQGVNIHSGNRVNQSGSSGIQQSSSNRPMMPHHHHMGGAHMMLHEQQHMDLPPRNLKNSQKGSQPNPDNVEQMDTSSEAGHQVDRTRQGERTSQSSEIVMQNHSDHQRIDLLNRHASKSSDNIPQSEKGNINMMMQANHPNHQRDLLNRHSSDSSTDRSSQMQQDLLNRHTSESSDSTSQSEKGNINMLMQSNHSDHQRELLNRHPSESSSDRSLQMQQSHSDSHIPHPVALIRGVNIHSGNRVNQSGSSGIQQTSSNRPMMPHHHHMGGAQSSEQIMPCLHPVPSKQY